MIILGINAYHGDAAAAVLVDGELVAAAEEERFNRKKHSAGFPFEAIRYCVAEAGISPREIDHVAIARDPRAHFAAKVSYVLRKRPSIRGFLSGRIKKMARVLKTRNQIEKLFGKGNVRARFHNVEHHKAHMASSFFVSPFDKAAILSIDGFGDFVSTMWGIGEGNRMKVLGQVIFPHSLGILYNALTQYLGFPHYGDEGKVMGLAPYGEPGYMKEFSKLIHLNDGMDFSLNSQYFCHEEEFLEDIWDEGAPVVKRIFTPELENLLGPAREPKTPLEKRHHDVAMSLQRTLEEAVLELVNRLYRMVGQENLCLTGGVAFNSVLNGRLRREGPFRGIYIPPAAGDAGTSIGAAFMVWHHLLGMRRSFVLEHAYTGPKYSEEYIENYLKSEGEKFEVLPEKELINRTAQWIVDGKVVGWFQGRMEFGPRALGNRSIVVDPRKAEMKDVLNARIKHREPFRPFAPSVLAENAGEWFEVGAPNPFMLLVHDVLPERRAQVPAITHVDGSGRLQTVHRETNPIYWSLIKRFEELTGVPVVLNTSFNENEPIVCSPHDALLCFRRTKMDVLVIGRTVIVRKED